MHPWWVPASCSALTLHTARLHSPCTLACKKQSTHACMQGVMLSHSAVIAEVAGIQAFLKQLQGVTSITEDDVVLSYLPLAHIFDRSAGRLLYWSKYYF